MIIYNLNILFIILLIIFNSKLNIKLNKFIFNLFFLYTLFFVGLRECGADWNIYIDYFEKITENENFKLSSGGDLLFEYTAYVISKTYFGFVQEFINQLDLSMAEDFTNDFWNPIGIGDQRETSASFYFFTLFSALLCLYPIFKFCSRFQDRWTCLLIAYPYFIIIVSMSAIRQSIAIGFLFLAIISLLDKKKILFIFYILIGTLFHKSLIIMMSLLVLTANEIKFKYIFLFIILCVVTYIYRADEINRNIYYYLGSGQELYFTSKGVWMRIIVNILAVILYLNLEKKFKLSQNERNIYFAYAIMICFFSLVVTMSTLASDRLLMYSAPFQILVYYKFIYAFSDFKKIKLFNQIMVYSLILGAFYVWILFSGNSFEWLPYENLILRI